MYKRALTVTYSPIKNNFVLLPETYLRLINTYSNAALQLSFKTTNHCVSWLPYGGAVENHQIGISAVVADILGLKEGDTVQCTIMSDIKNLSAINVSPLTKKDLEVLQMSPTRVQNELLDQIRIVNRGQVIVAWISRSIFLSLKVDSMHPAMGFGRLEQNSQLIVSTVVGGDPLARYKPADGDNKKKNGETKPPSTVLDRFHQRMSTSSSFEDEDLNNRVANVVRREHPYRNGTASKRNSYIDSDELSPSPSRTNLKVDEFNGMLNGLKRSVTNADIRLRDFENEFRGRKPEPAPAAESWTDVRRSVEKEINESYEFRVISCKWNEDVPICNAFITQANLIGDLDVNQLFVLKTNGDKEHYINLKLVDHDPDFSANIYPTIKLNENLMQLLELKPFERVTIKPKQTLLNRVDKIELIPSKKIDEASLSRDVRKIETTFKTYIIDSTRLYPLLLNQGQVMRVGEFMVSVKLWPTSLKCAQIDSKILRENKIDVVTDDVKSVASILQIKEEKDEEETKSKLPIVDMGKFNEVKNECVERLKESLCLNRKHGKRISDNLLFVGLPNSGKTTLVNEILKSLSASPYFCYVHKFSCIKNKGRKPESIQKELRVALNKCLLHYPAVLVLDTLDYLTQAEGEQPSQDSEYFNKVSDMIRDVLIEHTEHVNISVIATVTSVESLNKRIFPRKGYHIFHKIISVPQLDKVDRESFIKESCLKASVRDRKLINWAKFANMTDGYKIGDLAFFIERAIYYAHKKNPREPTLTDENLRDALRVTNEIFLQGIESHSQNELEEADIAGDEIPGLEKAIEVFEEVIKWPTEFPGLFESSPIKPPKGVLLYGPPGVGKTFFVRQIAKTWSLRMISVKGPELLAKYIGQSEENVRNLFQKARAAKPCILFFDEFDSLAPRRGHDSTGVTDRVVNQFLTQLDGVEELRGVIVVAATSRPELLDPAIIRPGRIDRHVEVALPNKQARFKILKALSSSLHLDANVDLKVFGENMVNFTGADIMSFLTTANMDAVQEYLQDDEDTVDFVVVNDSHMKKALQKTRPSIKPADLERYKHTYAQFINKSEPTPMNFVGQKATLA